MANDLNSSEIQETVRKHYADAARLVIDRPTGGSSRSETSAGCAPDPSASEQDTVRFGAEVYSVDERAALPEAAVVASLGCGNPTAVAELHEGDVVLDLGSGGGIDVLLSARRVGRTGLAYGLDMTDEMLALARENQAEAGVENVKWLKGTIEDIPLPAASVDVVISNCVINLSVDKSKVIREAARVLKPAGRFAVTDVIADEDMDEATRADMQAFTGCIAGALTRNEFERALIDAGFASIEIIETHRVHEHAISAIVRARKPNP
jgi:arsenite methyltransferase